MLSLLLVSKSPNWGRAVHAAAADIGALVEESSLSARAALSLLMERGHAYSHLLLEPACADGLMNALVGLTSGEAGSGTAMLLLGKGGSGAPLHVPVIQGANRRSVARALAAKREPGGAPVEMKAAELRDVASGSLIETRYQPIVRLADGQPAGLETLVRLNHPIFGTLAPDLFVPQIEACGLGHTLTETVAIRAFSDFASDPVAHAGLFIALNFPLDVLLQARSLDRLDEIRAAAGLPAGRITLELTESKPVADLHALGLAVERVRCAGYGLAIDDVAPTVPHHQAMMAMPFTAMKLDKSVVQGAATDETARGFARQAIDCARERGLVVVAEGVEDLATWVHMRALGADQAQGFFVSRALPFAALPLWMETWKGRPDFA